MTNSIQTTRSVQIPVALKLRYNKARTLLCFSGQNEGPIEGKDQQCSDHGNTGASGAQGKEDGTGDEARGSLQYLLGVWQNRWLSKKKRHFSQKTKQSFSQHVTDSQKPQSLRRGSCSEKRTTSSKSNQGTYTDTSRTGQNALSASESYPVGKNLNSGKRHLMGDVHRRRETKSEDHVPMLCLPALGCFPIILKNNL